MSNIACLDDGHGKSGPSISSKSLSSYLSKLQVSAYWELSFSDTAPVNMNERQSIYSMAMSHNGNTLVTGTTEKVCTLCVWERAIESNIYTKLLCYLTFLPTITVLPFCGQWAWRSCGFGMCAVGRGNLSCAVIETILGLFSSMTTPLFVFQVFSQKYSYYI